MRTAQQLAALAQRILDETPIDQPAILMIAIQHRDVMRQFAERMTYAPEVQ